MEVAAARCLLLTWPQLQPLAQAGQPGVPSAAPRTGSAKKLLSSPKTHLNGIGMASSQLDVLREQPVFAASVSGFTALMMPTA